MALVTTYNPLPLTFTHGEGIWLFDEKNTAYLDAISGIAVCGLGHCHPDVTHTIQQQAAKLIHTSNLFHIKEQQLLAEKLTQITNMEQVFFGNSGAEANEAAIKLTRLYGHQQGIETPSIIVMEGAFHGRTMATLTASGSRKVQAGFEPFVPGFIRAPFNNLDALKTIAHNRHDVVAVMVEPIQGEGGVHIADESYLRALSHLCTENKWLFILDEIQTGNGRTGAWYAHMHSGITPDILTTAKGLANGIPIGACLMRGPACDLFKPGTHGSTFGGNPLACATALSVLHVIERDQLVAQAKQRGNLLKECLMHELQQVNIVSSIRGKGLMLGIELTIPALPIRLIGIKNGILLNVTAENVIRILPPLIISEAETHELVKRLVKSITDFEKELSK